MFAQFLCLKCFAVEGFVALLQYLIGSRCMHIPGLSSLLFHCELFRALLTNAMEISHVFIHYDPDI